MSCLRDLRGALPGPERSKTEGRWRWTTSSPQEKGERTPRRCGSGGSVLFLPPYSPDFSPIEEAFSKVKDILAPGRDLHPQSPAESDRLDTRCPKHTGRCELVRTAATTLSIIIAMKTALKQFEEYQQVRQVS